jgi:hypothetical protein
MMKKTRKEMWEEFVGKINEKTPSKTVWDKIRQFSGNRKTHKIRHSNGVKTDDPKMMADELAKPFSKAGACTQYKDYFKKKKEKK